MLYRATKLVGSLLFLFNQAVLLLLIALLIAPTLTASKEYIWLSTQMSEVVKPQLLLLSSSITARFTNSSSPAVIEKMPTTSSKSD